MEVYAKSHARRENNGNSTSKCPRFILITMGQRSESSVMEIPRDFIKAAGDKIPSNVRIQFPNGRQVHVHYNRAAKGLTGLRPLYIELGWKSGYFLIMSYEGNGVFSVAVIGSNRTEIEYGLNRRIPRSPVTWQDKQGGKRWKFLAYAAGTLYLEGSIPIGAGFLERFEHLIPESIIVCLANGDQYQCKYSTVDKRIHGIITITEDYVVEPNDILIFTYRGSDKFELTIFNKSRVEKLLKRDIIEIDSDTSADSGVEEDDDDDDSDTSADSGVDEGNDDDTEHGDQQNQEDNEPDDDTVAFEKILSWSNAHGSCHGVHIPGSVKPAGREWEAGDTITLQTDKGSWNVGIVMNNGVPRMSKGWNKFCAGNNLMQSQKLTFRLVQNVGVVVFMVE